MVKEWDTLGIHLWTEAEGILFLQSNQAQYSLGPATTTDHATQTNPPNYVQTTLTLPITFGAQSIQVASIANILAGDNIGILMSGGEIFWSTVNGSPTGNTVNLTTPLTDSANPGAIVVDYTTPILRPLRIVAARRFNLASGIETPMVRMSRLDYRDLPEKQNPGTTTQYFYDPLGGAVQNGQLYVWPVENVVNDAVKFTWYRQLQDFNNPGDNPDFPQEWINPLVYNLAVEMAPEFDMNPQRYQMLKAKADESLSRVFGWDREDDSVYFGVSIDYPQGRSSA